MKKKYIATLVAIMLLAGCGTPAPAAPSTTDEPDMEAIIQQSVDEAVQEKVKEYEEEQKKKDEEIAKLKEQLEDLTAWYFWGPRETVLGSISGSVMDKISRKYAASTNYDPDIDWSTWYADAFNEYRNIAEGSVWAAIKQRVASIIGCRYFPDKLHLAKGNSGNRVSFFVLANSRIKYDSYLFLKERINNMRNG